MYFIIIAKRARIKGDIPKKNSSQNLGNEFVDLGQGKTISPPSPRKEVQNEMEIELERENIPSVKKLTKRQREILREFLTKQCPSNKDLAKALYLSYGTVRNQMSNIIRRLGVRNRTELASFKQSILLDLT
jgi:DNA-binding NarL/FixJ family response regulator